MKSTVLKEDLDCIAEEKLEWEKFRDKTFVVSGATGLIGSLFVRALLKIEQKYTLHMKVLAAVRDEKKAERLFSDEEYKEPLTIIRVNVCSPWGIQGKVDYIIHAAAITASGIMVEHPTEVIRTALYSMENALELARCKKVEKMVFLSSMEMYGSVEEESAKENSLGYVDLSNVRTCYPESKRMCECMAVAWAKEWAVPVCTARLAQTFGPGISEGENRIFAQLAGSVINGKDIILRTEGKSEGNYCYTRDVITALFTLLLHGRSGEAYNVVNEKSHMQIRNMAQLVAERVAAGRINICFDIAESNESLGYAADVKLFMSSEKLRKLGWQPKVGLEESYQRLIADLRERADCEENRK